MKRKLGEWCGFSTYALNRLCYAFGMAEPVFAFAEETLRWFPNRFRTGERTHTFRRKEFLPSVSFHTDHGKCRKFSNFSVFCPIAAENCAANRCRGPPPSI